jgi:hypothetical protein
VVGKVISASKANGADESGLTALIWNQVLSYGTDAMITVALAGTVFFSASAGAKRGNVLLYLLVTMAPFAVVAPVIGPVLDRFQQGRRWTMAATGVGRAILALIMAAHSNDLLVLYPCALGSLVLSKAYAVVRAAAAPRLLPEKLTLTEANSRLTIFGLGSTLILGGFVGLVIKVTGSYPLGLIVTAAGFATCAFFAVRMPRQIDSPLLPENQEPDREQMPTNAPGTIPRTVEPPQQARRKRKLQPISRLLSWARRGFADHLITALQGESALRLQSGLLTIYLAFYIESTAHGFQAALDLGGVAVGVGAGNMLGTAIGSRVKLSRPELVIIASTIASAAAFVLVAIGFDMIVAVIGLLVSAVCNSLSKVALDSLIQRDVPETLRSSAFARSETFLQLAWVIGAAIGVVLPADRHVGGALGFWVTAAILGSVAVIVTLRHRALGRRAVKRTAPARSTADAG